MKLSLIALILTLGVNHVSTLDCPLGYSGKNPHVRRGQADADPIFPRQTSDNCPEKGEPVDYDAVRNDIKAVFTNSQDFWPADFGNYAPFMIRLAWHCSGSYRVSDGRGGCDGGRIRFSPELTWPDNQNLDKALKLLESVKAKHCGISWGDLIVLTGNTALESMGVPKLGFCGGRVDDVDGKNSLELGPSAQQEAIVGCAVNGECKLPLGANTVGLIYVNPEGHLANGDPKQSSADIREVFARMGHDDRNTVSLIAGGHTFGKTHGACPLGPDNCGSGPLKGKGNNTVTSGFEGPWTTQPTKWTNQYLENLFGYNWTIGVGPGGHKQFFPSVGSLGIQPPSFIRMLVADVALLNDKRYKAIATEYKNNFATLANDFSESWYKLTTHDMGPAWRCKGQDVPPPRPFQMTLPTSPFKPNLHELAWAILPLLSAGGDSTPTGGKSNVALFVTLAYNCASTFRQTDYSGGCNGARILLKPESQLKMNAGLSKVFSSTLQSLKCQQFSSADLISAAGAVALKSVNLDVPFVSGRVDLTSVPSDAAKLAPRTYYKDSITAFLDNAKIQGLTLEQAVALQARPRSASQQILMGYSGSFSNDPATCCTAYFQILLGNTWVPSKKAGEFVSKEKPNVFMTATDAALLANSETLAIVKAFATNGSEGQFKEAFSAGWNQIMNSDVPPEL